MRKKINKIGVSCLLFIVSAVLFNTCLSKAPSGNNELVPDYPQIAERGKLVVVTDYSSIGYYLKGDTVEGFNYELLQMFQEYTPIGIEIVLESSLQKSIEGLERGDYNIIARAIPTTSDLKNKILFSEPITQNKQILVQRKPEFNNEEKPLRSHLDLAQKTLYVPEDSPVILRIKNLSKEIGDTIYYVEDELYGAEQLAIMVANGEIDFAVCDEQTAKKMSGIQSELDVETMIGFTQFEAWAVSKDAPMLLDSLNVWIDKAQATKKYQKLYKRYYR